MHNADVIETVYFIGYCGESIMRTGLKILISLITSLIFFAALYFLSFSGNKSFIETNFYQPSIINSVTQTLYKIADSADVWHQENQKSFLEFMQLGAIKRSFLQQQTEADIRVRDEESAKLVSSVTGLTGIRFIESQSQKIHFSTFSSDILLRKDSMISYEKYGKRNTEIPINFVSTSESGKTKILADVSNNLFLYCMPFYDEYDICCGTAIFYVTDKAFLRKLVSDKVISLSDDIHLLTDEAYSKIGLVTGIPYLTASDLKEKIFKAFEKSTTPVNFLSFDDAQNWILISVKTDFGYAGQICEKKLFLFPPFIKYFLLVTSFITMFLITFLLLNIKRDKFCLLQTKIQKLHLGILKNYLQGMQTKNWDNLRKELEYKRHEANEEIKKHLGKKFLKKNEKQIDMFLQNSWDEIFDLIGKKKINDNNSENNTKSDFNASDIRSLLIELIEATKTADTSIKNNFKPESNLNNSVTAEVSAKEEVAELDEIPEAEPVEELEEIDEASEAEPVEELEELDEIPEAEPVEELAEINETSEPESIEELEELDEAPTEGNEKKQEISSTEKSEEFEDVSIDFLSDENTKTDDTVIDSLIDFAEEISADSPDKKNEREKEAEILNAEAEEFADNLNKTKLKNDNYSDDDFFKNYGYQISGLNFSELNVPISKLKDEPAQDVIYLDNNSDFQKKIWGKYSELPATEALKSSGETEVHPLLEVNDETIINENGVFVINKKDAPPPLNKDFKNLVDSVLESKT